MNFRIDGLGLTSALIFAVLVITGCSDRDDRVNALLAQGVEHFENDELKEAKLEFNKALKIDKSSAESYYYLGQIDAAKGDTRAALNNYKRAVEWDIGYTEARIQLGHAYINLQKPTEAQAQIDAVLSADADNSDARVLQALILIKQRSAQNGVALLQKILKSSPGNLFATEQLTRFYLETGEESKALQVLEHANKANSGTENSVLRQLLALYTQRKLSSEAEQVLLQLVENNPNNLKYYQALIEFYGRLDQIDKAVLIIRDSITKDSENEERYQLLIDVYKQRYGIRKAIIETRELISGKPEMGYIRLALGGLYESNQQLELAEKVYLGVVDMEGSKPDGLSAKIEIAKLSLIQNNLPKAEQLVEEVLVVDIKFEKALLLRSRIAMQQKDYKLALATLDTAINENPDSALARMQKAVFLERLGKLDESLVQIDAILDTNANLIQVLRLKAKVLLQQNKTKQLESVYTKLETASPGTVDGPLGNGKLYLSQKKYSQAVLEFQKAYSRDPDSLDSIQGVVRARVAAGETKAAERFLNKLIREKTLHPIATELLGTVYLAKSEYASAEKAFLQQLEIGTESQEIYIHLAQSRIRQDDKKGAFDALSAGLDKQPKNVNLLLKLSQAYLLFGELDGSAEALGRGLALEPKNSKLKALLASVREKQERYDEAISLYEQVLQQGMKNPAVVNNLAALLVNHRSDEVSLARAGELIKQIENLRNIDLWDTAGWVYYHLGKLDKAAEKLSFVVQNAKTVAVYQYHLGMVYYKQGKLDAARDALAVATADSDTTYYGIDEARSTYAALMKKTK